MREADDPRITVDDRMPVGWFGMVDGSTGSFAATNGAIVVHGNLRRGGPHQVDFPPPAARSDAFDEREIMAWAKSRRR